MPATRPHPVVVYTLARIVLFAVVLTLLLLGGLPVPLAVIAAFLLSGLVSLFLLSRQRDAVSGVVARRLGRQPPPAAPDHPAEDRAGDDAPARPQDSANPRPSSNP